MKTDITELAQSLKAEGISPERMEWLKKLADMKYCASNPGHWLMNLKETNYLASLALQCLESNSALVEALEKAQHRIDELENDEVRQRLANAEHQLYMAELAKHNLKASRKAQFCKRRAAEKRIAELEEAEQKLCAANVTLDARAELAERQLAELESRTVTVKLTDINEYLAEVHDKTLNRAFRLLAEGVRAGDVAAMRAAGIKVEVE
ncbi:hypothetical protein [Klebsiella pneumoniae]|uniref:hypothetical protein n=1 Tax=Klebsiella pneumoniae TaxID=573 RepID=UPI000E2A88DC|nr:hypothetical protein [Klebsiella pneumoniae]SYM97307.1 Uncharacterised protein [Klebsiella pneumoniae]